MVALVILGSYVGIASAGVPLAFAANTVTVSFYSNPQTATITVDSNIETYGWTGTFALGQRVHVIANPPSSTVGTSLQTRRGHWEFVGWVVKGVSIDSTLYPNTYITIGQGEGSVTAFWEHVDPNKVERAYQPIAPPTPTTPPPPPPPNDDTSEIPQ